MLLPTPRGDLSDALIRDLRDGSSRAHSTMSPSSDDDAALSLWTLYELHYRGFDDAADDREWDPDLLRVRAGLERSFEADLREHSRDLIGSVREAGDVVETLTAMTTMDLGPSLARYLHRHATRAQYLEFLVQRSIYHLKESDPHAFTVPRLDGPAKVALAELQYDEFGAGRATSLHSQLFADGLAAVGLDASYGAYVDVVPTYTLELNNAMSLFGLHRRLRGASMGHLAAFEMTSSLPCRRYLQGAERLGLPPEVGRYFDEHIEADAVHEQLAARDICQRLIDDDPALRDDVLLGAAACLLLEARVADAMITAWDEGRNTLIAPARGVAA